MWIFSRRVRRRHRRPLVGARPAGPLVQRAEPRLLLERVDLDHDPVDLVVELAPTGLPRATRLGDLFERLEPHRVRVDREAAPAQPLERLPVRVELDAFAEAGAVDPDREWPVRGDRRVFLAQRAGRGVARVRRDPLARGGGALVERPEAGEGHVDLAPHLEHGRRVVIAERERDRADRAQVRRHVLALLAVAAGRAADECAVLVDERDRRAVDLRLEHVHDRLVRVEPLPHVLAPLEHRLVGRDLLERAHRRQVPYLLEPVGERRADALGRRVGRDELRVGRLELLELVVEPVVLGVGERRVVQRVVAVRGIVELLPQLGRAVLRRGRQGAPRRCRRRRPGARPRAARARGSDPTSPRP